MAAPSSGGFPTRPWAVHGVLREVGEQNFSRDQVRENYEENLKLVSIAWDGAIPIFCIQA